MSDAYVSAEPITLREFLALAKTHGFKVERSAVNGVSIIHADERGCFGISEEESEAGGIHVGFMNDPKLVEVFVEGSEEYYAVTGEGGDYEDD